MSRPINGERRWATLLVPEVMWDRPAQVRVCRGTGGQAPGERGPCRASPHLQGQAGTEAPAGGDRGALWPKGRDAEAGNWVPGLPELLWDSQGLHQAMGRGGQSPPHSWPNTAVAVGWQRPLPCLSSPLQLSPYRAVGPKRGEWERPGLLPRGVLLLSPSGPAQDVALLGHLR